MAGILRLVCGKWALEDIQGQFEEEIQSLDLAEALQYRPKLMLH